MDSSASEINAFEFKNASSFGQPSSSTIKTGCNFGCSESLVLIVWISSGVGKGVVDTLSLAFPDSIFTEMV
ncbi:hypothetical protein D9M70_495660 [compost metagenome]